MKDIDNQLEDNIVDALLGAAAYRTEEQLREINIVRGERTFFKFKVHGLTEDEFIRCRRQNTKNRGRRDELVDWIRYSGQVIYEATTADDKKRLWQNHDVWDGLNVASGVDVVLKVLTPAERAKILEVIESISGFDDIDLDTLVQNL